MGETASMAKVLVVTSGKGGVGKTTSTAALGAALAQAGQKVAVVDFDVGLRNLDLVMGAERRVVFDLVNVIQGVAKLSQALIRDKRLETLWLLPASQTRDKDALTEDGVAEVINELRGKFDWVICDSPAGIEGGATLAMRFADVAVIVTNPEVSSHREARAHHALRRPTRRARRDAQYRRRARHPLHAPLRHHSRKRGGASRLQFGHAGDDQQYDERSSARLSRCRPQAQGRRRADEHPQQPQGLVRQAVRTESGMNVFNLFRRRGSAPVARERLQILLSYERAARGQSDLLAVLREDILAALTKHITVERENVQVRMDRGENV